MNPTANIIKVIDRLAAEKQTTAQDICKSIGLNYSYLSQARTDKNKSITLRVAINLSLKYKLSLDEIIFGKQLTEPEIIRELKKIRYTQEDIIKELIEAMIEVKARLTNPQKQLVQEAKKRIQ